MPHLQDIESHSTLSFENANKQSSRARIGGHISGLRHIKLQDGIVRGANSIFNLTWALLRVTKAVQEESWRQATKDTMLSLVFEQISKTLDFTTARLAVSKIHNDSLQSAETERILL